MNEMQFLQTPSFAKWVRKNRLQAAVEQLSADIVADPEKGEVIPNGRGLRKIRMAGQGRGKQGGFRVIYLLCVNRSVTAFLEGYSKSEKENITASDLKRMVEQMEGIEAAALQLQQQNQGSNDENENQEGA
jgi:hypothetical protein